MFVKAKSDSKTACSVHVNARIASTSSNEREKRGTKALFSRAVKKVFL
jgi:hypothetical protein